MLEVDINKIIPITEARDNFNKLVEDVSASDALYVLTTNGKPSAVIVGVHHLEKLTGQSDANIVAKMSNLANNLGETMEDPMTSTPATDDAADDSIVPAVAEDTTPAATPADEPVAAPDLTPAAPTEEIITEMPEPATDAPSDPFAASMPTPTEEAPAAPAIEDAPETPAPAASDDDADGNVLPNIGGQV